MTDAIVERRRQPLHILKPRLPQRRHTEQLAGPGAFGATLVVPRRRVGPALVRVKQDKAMAGELQRYRADLKRVEVDDDCPVALAEQ